MKTQVMKNCLHQTIIKRNLLMNGIKNPIQLKRVFVNILILYIKIIMHDHFNTQKNEKVYNNYKTWWIGRQLLFD